jgi:hypothetical protein
MLCPCYIVGYLTSQNFTVIKGLEKRVRKILFYTMKLSQESLIFLSDTAKRNMKNVVLYRNRAERMWKI